MQSYISAIHDWDTDQILVWERPVEGGERTVKLYPAPRYFYTKDPKGKFTTITGETVTKNVFENEDEFKVAAKAMQGRLFESDIKPLARVLMDEYYNRPTPIVHYAFVDIEVDYSSKLGFSSPENPYAPINAVTIYQSWTGEYMTYAVPPKKFSKKDREGFQAAIEKSWEEHKLGFKANVTICETERDLLLYMLADIEDADIISGWNSEFFDIPYIIKRLERVLGKKSTQHMCFKGAPPPRERTVQRFGSPAIVYQLQGRSHLDYLDLFKKFTFEGRVSYSLGNIAAEELDVPKLDYPGTLEQLYNNDFVHFVTYNARDVEVLVKLDLKFKLMQLVNQMAHENTVPFEAILGTVRYVETGIMNRAHNVHKLICTNKVIPEEDNEKVEGAIVMTPLAGLFEWLGSVDITSLYPSVIRALNMSVETYIGQFVNQRDRFDQLYGERAWASIRAKTDEEWTAETVQGVLTMTGAEWHEVIRELGYALSAFGTLFDQSKPGMVADTLTFWFAERKRLQAEKKKYGKLAKEEQDPAKKLEYQKLEEHYDLLQLTKKIQLNSTYGALLNEAFRFGRREIGASVTGTGRQITMHMATTIGTLVAGHPIKIEKAYAAMKTAGGGDKYVPGYLLAKARREKNWDEFNRLSRIPVWFPKEDKDEDEEDESSGAVYWTQSEDVIYGDTDSCYFQTHAKSYDEAVAVADEIAAQTNATFPAFMSEAFNCTGGRETLIKAAREVVAERGMFLLAKKKYTLKVVNLDGVDLRDKPKLKSMGSEIKKADTPKVVQDFLKGLMDLVLSGEQYPVLEKFVNENRKGLIHKNEDLMSLGVAKQINNLDAFHAAWTRNGKKDGKVMMKNKHGEIAPTNVPGHVRAAINYNELIGIYAEGTAKALRSGDKGVIFYLKANEFGYKTIAFPADMNHLPEWFTENFKIDLATTEKKMMDAKLQGIFEALGAEVPTLQQSFLNSVFTF